MCVIDILSMYHLDILGKAEVVAIADRCSKLYLQILPEHVDVGRILLTTILVYDLKNPYKFFSSSC